MGTANPHSRHDSIQRDDLVPDANRQEGALAAIAIVAAAATAGDDSLTGTAHSDHLDGQAGNDTIAGLARDDALSGGLGNDSLDGGTGDDSLAGGDDDDVLSGDDGRDSLSGGAGQDTLDGGDGRDSLAGGGGFDSLAGGGGNDTLSGGADDDQADGGGGNDEIGGGSGFDFLLGGAGADTINGGDDDDSLFGEDGKDVINGGRGFDFMLGGEGADTINGGAGGDFLGGEGGDDILRGQDGSDNLDGGDGNDDLGGGRGFDFIAGGAGNDSLQGNEDDDFLDGGEDSDTVAGGTGNDGVFGSGGNDSLEGQAGDDFIGGGGGDDTLVGGTGNDAIDGDVGTDIVVFSGKSTDYRITLDAGFATVEDLAPNRNGDDGLDTLTNVEFLQFRDALIPIKINTPPGPISDVDPSFEFIMENSAIGTLVGITALSTDPNGDTVTYSLLDDAGGRFAIDAASGVVTVAGVVDAEQATQQKITVQASDGEFSTTQDFTIFVGDVNEFAPSTPIDVNAAPNRIAEGVEREFPVGITIQSVDPDVTSFVTYTLLDDAGGRFFIHPTSGIVEVIDPSLIDFETASKYTIVVQASDGTFASTSSFEIDITDVSELDLRALAPGQGAVILGQFSDFAGSSASTAGDINGDGFDDVIIGAYRASGVGGQYGGKAYVIFGKADGIDPSIDVATMTADQGFTILGASNYDRLGFAVSVAGDINGDGFGDLILGAPYADVATAPISNEGKAYVIFGHADGFGTSLELASLTADQGFVLQGVDVQDLTGRSVSSAGDVNGDGLDDILVGASRASGGGLYTGQAYLIFGQTGGFAATIDLDALTPGQGLVIHGASGNDLAGFSVSSAGDIDGDGLDDVFIGAVNANFPQDPDNFNGGAGYVVFGSTLATSTSIDLGALSPSEGVTIRAVDRNDNLGYAVSTAGDFNGDGIDDLVIGAENAYSAGGTRFRSGEAYLILGQDGGLPATIDLSQPLGGQGIVIFGAGENDNAGFDVSAAGDINGDGYDDVLVASRETGDAFGPAAYLLFGHAGGMPASIDLAALSPSDGFVIEHASFNALAESTPVNGAGDVNGDGFDDIIIGAFGPTYIVYGGTVGTDVSFLGKEADDSFNGTGAAESFIGGLGSDTMTGGGGADVFRGGAGDDVIHVADTAFNDIDGGSGEDALVLDGSGLTLDLTAIANGEIQGIERIDITGSGDNSLALSVRDVLDLSDSSNTLLVAGDSGDSANIGSGWTKDASGGGNADGTSTIDGQIYQIYTAGQATLMVDTDISPVSA